METAPDRFLMDTSPVSMRTKNFACVAVSSQARFIDMPSDSSGPGVTNVVSSFGYGGLADVVLLDADAADGAIIRPLSLATFTRIVRSLLPRRTSSDTASPGRALMYSRSAL